MLKENIHFKNFKIKNSKKKIKILLEKTIHENNQIIKSLSKNYNDSFSKKIISKYKNFSEILLIGMGGSLLGARSIFNFLRHKIKKNFYFKDDYELEDWKKNKKKN